jgi:hypothetical protein
MLLPLIFLITLGVCCGYAITRGGVSEKIGGVIMGVSAVASWQFSSPEPVSFQTLETGILSVDVLLFLALLGLALKTERFWPIWATTLQGAAILTHSAVSVSPVAIPKAYELIQGFWAYPMLLLLVLGTKNHLRRQQEATASRI